jgi:hypothetical protein
MDDLFNDAPAPAAADDLFNDAPAPAAADDLFNDAPAPAADSAPAPADAFGDLFGDSPAPAADAAPAAADDLFNDAPAPAAPASDSLDDLFNAPADAAPAAPAENLDDIFGAAAASQQNVVSIELKPQVDPLADAKERVWIDNTGSFSTQGRLIEIGEDFVRLVKENGRTCTVPMDRLCPADAVYVEAVRTELQQYKLAMLTAR